MGGLGKASPLTDVGFLQRFRLDGNDGEWGVGGGESGNVELLTLTLSLQSNRN